MNKTKQKLNLIGGLFMIFLVMLDLGLAFGAGHARSWPRQAWLDSALLILGGRLLLLYFNPDAPTKITIALRVIGIALLLAYFVMKYTT